MTTAANVYHLWRTYWREPHKGTWLAEHPEYRQAIAEIVEVLNEPHD